MNDSAGGLSNLSTIQPLSSVEQNEHTLDSGSSPVPTLPLAACTHSAAASKHPLHTSHKAAENVAATQVGHQSRQGQWESSAGSTGTHGAKGLCLPPPPPPPSLTEFQFYLQKGTKHRSGSQLDALEQVCLLASCVHVITEWFVMNSVKRWWASWK